jgi:hypothetical protein
LSDKALRLIIQLKNLCIIRENDQARYIAKQQAITEGGRFAIDKVGVNKNFSRKSPSPQSPARHRQDCTN